MTHLLWDPMVKKGGATVSCPLCVNLIKLYSVEDSFCHSDINFIKIKEMFIDYNNDPNEDPHFTICI